MTEKKQAALRFDEDLLAAIDRRAKDVGLSRNEWIERCTRWTIHNLPFGADGPIRKQKAMEAPHDVAGEHSEDMGLDSPDGKMPYNPATDPGQRQSYHDNPKGPEDTTP